MFAEPASGVLHVGAEFINGLGKALEVAGVGEPGFEGGGDDAFIGGRFGGDAVMTKS